MSKIVGMMIILCIMFFLLSKTSCAIYWTDNSTNNTLAGAWILHSFTWTDSYGLKGYIFSFNNGTNWTDMNCNDYNSSQSNCNIYGCTWNPTAYSAKTYSFKNQSTAQAYGVSRYTLTVTTANLVNDFTSAAAPTWTEGFNSTTNYVYNFTDYNAGYKALFYPEGQTVTKAIINSSATNKEPFARFNFTISEDINSIYFVNVRVEYAEATSGSSGTGEQCYAAVANFTNKNWFQISTINSATLANTSINFTGSDVQKIIESGTKKLAILIWGVNMDSNEGCQIDWVEVTLGYNSTMQNCSGTSNYEFKNDSWVAFNTKCYQETYNVATACGGLSTGTLSETGSWSYVYGTGVDGNWATYAQCSSGTCYAYINYTKPYGSSNFSIWTVSPSSGGSSATNLTIPTDCWNAYSSTMSYRVEVPAATTGTKWYCFNTSGDWKLLHTGSIAYTSFREEAMWWSLNTLSGNITKLVNTTTGSIIKWKVWANNTYGLDNTTDTFQYTTTSSTFVDIIPSQAITDGITFSSSDPGTNDNAANNNTACSGGGTCYNISIDAATTVNIDLYHKATGNIISGSNTILIANVTTQGNQTSSTGSNLAASGSTAMTTSYATIGDCSNVPKTSTCHIRFWLDVPSAQVSGSYSTTYKYCAVQTGSGSGACS